MQNLQGLAFLAPVTHSEEYPEVRRGPHPLVQNEIRKTLAGPVLVAREEMLLAYAGKRAEALADPDLLRGVSLGIGLPGSTDPPLEKRFQASFACPEKAGGLAQRWN